MRPPPRNLATPPGGGGPGGAPPGPGTAPPNPLPYGPNSRPHAPPMSPGSGVPTRRVRVCENCTAGAVTIVQLIAFTSEGNRKPPDGGPSVIFTPSAPHPPT